MADGIPESKAKEIVEQIECLLLRNKVWYSVTMRREPGLKFIEFNNISIKVSQ